MTRTKHGRELPPKEPEAPEVPEDKGSSSEDETTNDEEIEDGNP